MNILVAGFPYVRPGYYETFNYFPPGHNIYFLLPRQWKIKGGKAVFRPVRGKNILTTRTFFHHSNYSFIGGALKGFMPFFPFRLQRLQRVGRLDFLYLCGEPILLSTLYSAVWARIFGIPYVLFTWENVDYGQKLKGFFGRVQLFFLKLNLLLCQGVVCGNKKAEDIIRGFISAKPTAVIPMSGADEAFFSLDKKPPEKGFRGVDLTGKVVFSFAGAIGTRKGIFLIIEAFNAVRKKIPDSFLIVAGSGEKDEMLDKAIAESGLSAYTIRVPWLDREGLRQLFSVTDIFVYPSISYKGWEEQFGYSMAEASLMEVPVISTRSGSIEEIVIEGETGILVEPDNVDQLTEAMIRLAEDKELREKMGRSGREHIVNNFSHKIVAQKFHEFFKKFV